MVSKFRKVNHARQPIFALIMLLLVSLSCLVDDLNPPSPTATWTPAPQIGTDFLRYDVPAYAYPLSPGQTIPGTGVRYVNRAGNDYSLTIDNVPSISPGNTQIVWEGIIRPSVFARYNFQITPQANSDNLNAIGPVTLLIFRPGPSELIGQPPEGAIHFTDISIGETASVGQRVAGTSLIYDGERNGSASFSGTLQTAVRPLNSSFIWYGSLKENVFIKHTLTVTNVAVDAVRLEGTAEIWIIPNN